MLADEMHLNLRHFVLSVHLNSTMVRPGSFIYKHRGGLRERLWSSLNDDDGIYFSG